MISVFAPGTMVAITYSLVAWAILTFRNFRDDKVGFAFGCLAIVFGYSFAFVQYIEVFYVEKLIQTDKALWLLFMRLLMHCAGVTIFLANYKRRR